jgi:hypothetical protein
VAYTLQDLAFGVGGTPAAPTGGVYAKLANRQDLIARGVYGWLQESILELSRDYRFENLEKTGPVVPLILNQSKYAMSYFQQPADVGTEVNLIPSLFRYFSTPINVTGANAGSTLAWKTIDTMELMINTPGTPTYFTRYGAQIWVAPLPQTPLQVYLRYQVEHPFIAPAAGPTDVFLLPNEWKDITEYAAAQRGAINIRMLDYASQYHTMLYGDPEFQRSSGGRGMPGLIFRRITQMEGDSESQMRQIQVHVSKA